MGAAYLSIDLDKIRHNAGTIVRLCARYGIEVAGVTKGACGLPPVARAMLRGGVTAIGESRLENIHRLKACGIDSTLMLLRIPALSEVDAVVAAADISLNSEFEVISALAEAARRRGRRHDIIIMIDLGDLREGVWPDDLLSLVRAIVGLGGVRLVGIGTSLSCFGGVLPSQDNMCQLADYACRIEREFGLELRYVSAGSSSALPLIAAGKMPRRINHVRIGEAILLGRETVHRSAWPGTFQDAFSLYAEVIELKIKPSRPIGVIAEDAFGRHPEFADKGEMKRAILALGRADVDVEGIAPLDQRLAVLGASSDHLILDVSAAAGSIRIGDELGFTLNYGALLAAMSSGYVEKRLVGGKTDAVQPVNGET